MGHTSTKAGAIDGLAAGVYPDRFEYGVQGERHVLADAAGAISAVACGSSANQLANLKEPYPWVRLLSSKDQQEFVAELVETAAACGSIGRFEALAVTLKAWRDSAEAIAAGWDKSPLDWLPAPIPVGRP